MEPIILDDIPFEVNFGALMKRLRLPENSGYESELQVLAKEAQAIARPKAVYGMAGVDAKGQDYVVIDGIKFDSRVLSVNLEEVYRVFPYVATCGTELESWGNSIPDILARFWAEAIQEQALAAAFRMLSLEIGERFHPGPTSRMNPGSLADWPLEQQRPLFDLIGDVTAMVGVRLTDSYLMLPAKSVSGIHFPREQSFENCQLCPRGNCLGRRAPYDAVLYEREYRVRAK